MRHVIGGTLVAVLLAGTSASAPATDPAQLYQQARSLLARVENTKTLIWTFHTDPRVLEATGLYLRAAEAENMVVDQMSDRFQQLFPNPPWEWTPATYFHRVRPGLYLVALSQAFAGTPGSFYLFDGPRHVKIDSGESGPPEVKKLQINGDRVEIEYLPTPASTRPVLASAVVEKSGTDWRVDRRRSE